MSKFWELERSPHVNPDAITQVLAGSGSYDALGEREQAAVREGWTEDSKVVIHPTRSGCR